MKTKLYEYNGEFLHKEQIAKLKGYYMDNNGNIYSKNNNIIKCAVSNGGYKMFGIIIGDKKVYVYCHRLQAFLKYGNKLYEDKIEVRHLDNNSFNNTFDNIVLGTHSENLLDSPKEVRSARSVKAGHAHRKYDHEKVVELFKSNLTYKEISQITNIPIKIVRSIIYKKL